MAGYTADIADLLAQTRTVLKQTKRERAAAMDAIVDLALERAELKAALRELVTVLDGLSPGDPMPADAVAVHIKARDVLDSV